MLVLIWERMPGSGFGVEGGGLIDEVLYGRGEFA